MADPKAEWVPHDPSSTAAPAPSEPGQLPLPCFTGEGDWLSVTQTAMALGKSADRVRQYAEMHTEDPTKGLPCIRIGPKRERYFPAEVVERFRLRQIEQAAEREAAAQTWRAPVAAKRS